MAPLEGVPVNPVDCHPQEGPAVGSPAVGSSGHPLLVEEQVDHLSPPPFHQLVNVPAHSPPGGGLELRVDEVEHPLGGGMVSCIQWRHCLNEPPKDKICKLIYFKFLIKMF